MKLQSVAKGSLEAFQHNLSVYVNFFVTDNFAFCKRKLFQQNIFVVNSYIERNNFVITAAEFWAYINIAY